MSTNGKTDMCHGHNVASDHDTAALIKSLRGDLVRLYSPTVMGKVWAIASKAMEFPEPPTLFPEYTEPAGTSYVYRDRKFWTSGFFPGILYQLLQRNRKHPSHFESTSSIHPAKLEFACNWWTECLHANATLTGTHDLGFLVFPWARQAWELNHDTRALETIKTASHTLLARFNPAVGLIRSWDTCYTRRYTFESPAEEFMTVIDNMMNLDMLFFTASHTGDTVMWEAAVAHARTTQYTHIRSDYSTTHLVVFDPISGKARQHLTNQGYADESCWTRGQAWAIAGFAEVYGWTRDRCFLDTASKCADYFLSRLPSNYIPPWDFDAVEQNPSSPQPPDTSAGIIACYGMLLIYRALIALGEAGAEKYLAGALRVTSAICASHMNPEVRMSTILTPIDTVEHGRIEVFREFVSAESDGGDTIINGATINNYEFSPRRWANHGLVYADYYFVLVGNMLLDMGIGRDIICVTRAFAEKSVTYKTEIRAVQYHP